MHLLFIHDNRFTLKPGGVYTSGAFPSSLWERYLRHFDELTVLGRHDEGHSAGQDTIRSDHPSVSFDFAPDIHTIQGQLLNRQKTRRVVEAAISRADAVIARLPSELGLLAASLAQKAGKPLAIELVGCGWDAMVNHGSPLFRLYAPLFLHRTRAAVGRAPLVIYVTSQWLQRRYPAGGRCFGVSDVEIAPLSHEDRRQRQARLEEIARGRSPKLGTAAALTPMYKGIGFAIEALKQLQEDGLSLSYSILGPGDPKPWSACARAAGVEHLISFDGVRQPGEGVRQWLDTIDIHLQPSMQEGLPRATLEAMSRGVACIGSTSGGIPELLPPRQLHRRGDAQSLAETIRCVATDPARIAEAAWNGFEEAQAYLPETLNRRRDEAYSRFRAVAESHRDRMRAAASEDQESSWVEEAGRRSPSSER